MVERLTLTEHLSAARMARHWVCEHCPEEHLPEARRWIAELLTHELVANALAHGHGPLTLSLTHDEEGILVGISDSNAAIPALKEQTVHATSGRGIAIVDALATAWGYYPSHSPVAPALKTPDWDDAGWPVPDDERPGADAAPQERMEAFPEAADSPTATGPAGKTVWFHLAAG
jgi:anti-sigma regulatory factor (Ser/Thr protein kinase)